MVEAMREAIEKTAEASSKTIGFVVWRATQILNAREDAEGVEMPSERTLYRLFDRLAAGTHATGSATTRRSVNARPAGPFGEVPACAPGEWMQIDSTPLDVLVRLDDGIAEKVELTAMIDLATRSLAAVVLRPTTKAADASALLARSITPETMRPGWSEALRMSRSAMPHRRLLALDERLEHAAAKPVIVPDTIVCDHGKVFISNNFRASCRYLGISLQPTHKASPFEKGAIEKTLGSVATLFAQFVAGYTGRSVDRRGRGLENGPLWSFARVAELTGGVDRRRLAEPSARCTAGPGLSETGFLAKREVRDAAGVVRLRSGPAQRRGLHRVAARTVAGDQRLRHPDQPPHL
ncbi:transposase family protein [Streptomyces sp. NPDC005393]|uniref:integrase catalytic domain-containing protein n=1 Tax=Streptomyces sp. NPDC005393 TaxID=3157041 RepID=UPI0033A78786